MIMDKEELDIPEPSDGIGAILYDVWIGTFDKFVDFEVVVQTLAEADKILRMKNEVNRRRKKGETEVVIERIPPCSSWGGCRRFFHEISRDSVDSATL